MDRLPVFLRNDIMRHRATETMKDYVNSPDCLMNANDFWIIHGEKRDITSTLRLLCNVFDNYNIPWEIFDWDYLANSISQDQHIGNYHDTKQTL
jgi:hypothetical protein